VVFSFIIALPLVAADQLSKFWIRSNLAVGESLFEAEYFRLIRVHNTGAAFGLFQGQSFLLTIIALVGVVTLVLYAIFFHRTFIFLNNRPGRLALGLVLGGAAGNLIDRIYLGYVTDFIDFNFWPAFNIADSAIVIGTVILAYSLLRLTRNRRY
jgi:signal peptidase II